MHVKQNSETLRQKWVKHEGNLELVVYDNNLTPGNEHNNWQRCVIDKTDNCFRAQIAQNTVPGVMETLVPDFTDTKDCE